MKVSVQLFLKNNFYTFSPRMIITLLYLTYEKLSNKEIISKYNNWNHTKTWIFVIKNDWRKMNSWINIFVCKSATSEKMHFVCWETRGRIYTLHQRPPVHSIMSSRLALGELYYKNWIGYEISQKEISLRLVFIPILYEIISFN